MSALLLADAKTHLNITVNTYDTELQGFIDAAEAVIGNIVGPLVLTGVSARVRASGGSLILPVAPAASVTSITDSGSTALVLADLVIDLDAGIVTYANGAFFADGWYTVEYSAGRSSMPADLLLAVKELVRHMWTTQRGATTRPGSAPPESMPGAAYALPMRVEQLIAPHAIHRVA